MARTTFSGPVKSDNGFEGAIVGNVVGNVTGNVAGTLTGSVDAAAGTVLLPAALVGALPSAATVGRILFVSDANSGAGAVCFSDGTDWIDIMTGVAVIA